MLFKLSMLLQLQVINVAEAAHIYFAAIVLVNVAVVAVVNVAAVAVVSVVTGGPIALSQSQSYNPTALQSTYCLGINAFRYVVAKLWTSRKHRSTAF